MKEKILFNLKNARKDLLTIVRDVPFDLKVTEKWSVKDVLSHIVGWDFHTVRAIEECLRGERPFYFDLNWDTLNEEEVEKRRTLSKEEILNEMEQSHRALLNLVLSLPEQRLTEYHGHRWKRYKITPESMLKAAIDHDIFHTRKIEAAHQNPQI